jgi:hypothetical protein
MLCERCGSNNVRRVRSTRVERVLRIFTGRKRFFCLRCGWSALRAWDEFAAPPLEKKRDLKLVDGHDRGREIESDSGHA